MEKLKHISPYRLSSLLRLQKDSQIALQLFQNPNKTSHKPFKYTPLSYDLIISKLGRAKMFVEMEQILQQMNQETRFSPKEILFCNVISFYGRARMPEQAIRIFDRIPSFNCQRTVRSLNCLLKALLNCRYLEKIRQIYLDLDRFMSPDVCTYNILINACCLNNSLDSAWKLFDEMRERGILPNVVTFGTLISALCANSKVDKAFRLKDEMRRVFGVKPNVFVYTSLIKALCKMDELDLAFKLKEEMKLDGEIGLDSAVYSTLISGLFKAGRKGEVVKVLEEMTLNGCKPDTVTYSAMIAGFCAEKDFKSAFGVLNEMIKKGCRTDVICYNVILSGLCKEGRVRDACDLLEDMPRRGCLPDVVSYRTIFNGLCNVMEFKEAVLILDEMVFKGFLPQVARARKLVEALCEKGDMDLLRSVLNSLAKQNAIDVGTWEMVISLECKNSEILKVYELFDSLRLQ